MSEGFNVDLCRVLEIKADQVQALLKEYKKYKKYKKSNVFTIKELSGDETIIKNLVEKYGNEDT